MLRSHDYKSQRQGKSYLSSLPTAATLKYSFSVHSENYFPVVNFINTLVKFIILTIYIFYFIKFVVC